MKTAEEILRKHTGQEGIYLTHGTIRGSDALEAMEEYAKELLKPIFEAKNRAQKTEDLFEVLQEIDKAKNILND